MADRPSTGHLAAWRSSLTALTKIVDQLRAELGAESQLALDWYEVLLLLRESDDGLRMHELADAQLLSRSAATRLVDRMAAAGLVARRPAEDDRRGTFVELTPKGLAALRRAAPVHLRGIQEHFAAHLSSDEAVVVAAAMDRIVAALDNGSPTA